MGRLAAVVVAVATLGASSSEPATVRHTWSVRWPEGAGARTYVRTFATRGGLIKRVRVSIGGKAVPGPPYVAPVACRDGRLVAGAQKSWVWDGRNVTILLLLQAGPCRFTRPARLTVTLTTVGT